jgi:cellobiose-specific phosphotransferase system component IIA
MKKFAERLEEFRPKERTLETTRKLAADIKAYAGVAVTRYAIAFDEASNENIEKACKSLVKAGVSIERLHDELRGFIQRREDDE